MKKIIVTVLTFIVVFFGALAFIHYKANPKTRLDDPLEDFQWHGHVENEFGAYNGALFGDLFSGTGSFNFLSGELYVGEWQNSYMEGDGTLIFPGIGGYTGGMKGSERSGQGVFIWYTGDKYEGAWENDEMSGEGKYTFANGMVLNGIFSNNHPVSGSLLYYYSGESEDVSDEEVMSLEYTFSETDKTIRFMTKGGLRYEGDLSGLNGYGNAKIIYPSGNTYSGEIVCGVRNGSGEFYWKENGGKVLAFYTGDWEEDRMHGKGEYHFTGSEYPYLKGRFEDNVPSGRLIYYKESGNTFATQWEDGICVSVEET